MKMTHIMENIIYNELVLRRYAVDVGVVYANGKDKADKQKRTAREIGFVATKGGKRVYIQSAYTMESSAKRDAELRPFALTGDFFPKIVVRHNGVLHIGVIDFLLDDEPV